MAKKPQAAAGSAASATTAAGQTNALSGVAPSPKRSRKSAKTKINRRDYQFAIFVGPANTPKHFCKTPEEVNAFVGTLAPSKLEFVDVAILKPVKVETKVTY